MQIKIYGKISVDPQEKYHYVYRITNVFENKHYYGKRSSSTPPQKDLYFNYKSSSCDECFINEQKLNPEHFKYKIVFVCSSSQEALDKERILHKKFDVARNVNFYNKIISGGTFDNVGYVSVKDVNGITKTMSLTEFKGSSEFVGVKNGLITVYKNDQKLTIPVSDKEIYMKDGWVLWMENKTLYRDSFGKIVIADSKTAKELNLVGINKNKIPVRDNFGNKFLVEKGDPRLNVSVFCIVGSPNITTFKDVYGNIIKTSIDDPRVKTRELVGVTKGVKLSEEHKNKIKIANSLNRDKFKNNSKIFTVYDKDKHVYCVIDTFENDYLLKMRNYNLPVSVFYLHKPGEPFYEHLIGKNTKGANISIGKLDSSFYEWRSVIGYSYSVIQFNSILKRQQYFNESTRGNIV